MVQELYSLRGLTRLSSVATIKMIIDKLMSQLYSREKNYNLIETGVGIRRRS